MLMQRLGSPRDANRESGLCGLWVSPTGSVHYSIQGPDNQRRESQAATDYFIWSSKLPLEGTYRSQVLAGDGLLRYQIYFKEYREYRSFIAYEDKYLAFDYVANLENQYLLRHNQRLFSGLRFTELRRCQCHIETNGSHTDKRILAIGLTLSDAPEPLLFTLADNTDSAERKLLETFSAVLHQHDPDVIEGHNIFNIGLKTLYERSRHLELPALWGRFGQPAKAYKTLLSVGSRRMELLRFDLPGRTVFDTYLAAHLFDNSTTRDWEDYSLQSAAHYLGVRPRKAEASHSDKAIRGSGNPAQGPILENMTEALHALRGVADCFLPTYFAQISDCPMTLQEAYMRGHAAKINLMLAAEYHKAGHSLPRPRRVQHFAGGYAHSFGSGVYRKVLHFDIASLYPSLLLRLGRNPAADSLGVFIPLLAKLRQQRLDYKQRAKTERDTALRHEYGHRQSAFKLLINSFYGYLGFQGARFSDSDLAAEITHQGRTLLQSLIEGFQACGVQIIEADTDGLYLSSPQYYDKPKFLLEKAQALLPQGINLEYEGRYLSMFCYKTKNYALYDGKRVIVRGSALRSRDTEPYLRDLVERIVQFLLGIAEDPPKAHIGRLRDRIHSGRLAVEYLAKTENLNQDLDTYREKVRNKAKRRRAASEVALTLDPKPQMGAPITYYLTPKKKGQNAEWQRARSLELFDSSKDTYDIDYYLQKLDKWFARFEPFFTRNESADRCQPTIQGELF